LRYATFRLEDGTTFVHVAESESATSPLNEVDAFQAFQKEIADRCEEQPVVTETELIGSYGFAGLGDQR
jgi:hypothetical protein